LDFDSLQHSQKKFLFSRALSALFFADFLRGDLVTAFLVIFWRLTMPAVTSTEQFLEVVRKSGLIEDNKLDAYLDSLRDRSVLPDQPRKLAQGMVRDALLTSFQSDQLLRGHSRGYLIGGKYRLLEHLGSGGMGLVYLCEHISMHRLVAIKVLPSALAKDASYLKRFYREARAVAALDHPNIVRAHDIDQGDQWHFLVMEFVDGINLLDLVKGHGPLDIARAAHYIRQAACGLQHADDAGIVHRDIKPGNLLVDRGGTVKILDMGLVRFFHDDDDLSKRLDKHVLGTTDYLAPEQTVDSHVDIRADIYSLGVTFYFCLTGKTLYGEGNIPQKLIWQQVRRPRSLRTLRPEVPAELADLIEKKMLAKEPQERFQKPREICTALAPWTETPPPPPSAEELPRYCPLITLAYDLEAKSGIRTRLLPPRRRSANGKRPSSISPQPAAECRPPSADAAETPISTRKTAINEQEDVPQPCPMPAKEKARPRKQSNCLSGVAASPRAAGRTAVWIALTLAIVLGSAAVAGGLFLLFQRPEKTNAQPADKPGIPPIIAKKEKEEPAPATNEVAIQMDGKRRRITTPHYQAVVAEDGCLTSLAIAGADILYCGGPISRGMYCFEGIGPVKMTAVDQPAANVILAKSDKASIRYEFTNQGVNFSVANQTDKPMPFFIVFAPVVKVVQNDAGEWARAPLAKDWHTTTWYTSQGKIQIKGGNKIWGPFDGPHQVWQAQLQPRETRRVSLQVAALADGETAKVAAVSGDRVIKTSTYEAVVEADGCLTSLRVGEVELLYSGGAVSRGSYFFRMDKGALKLPHIQQPNPQTLLAQSDQASINYLFGPDTLTWTVKNPGKEPMPFYLVFSDEVKAVLADKGELAATPATLSGKTTTWFAGPAKLTIEGGNKIWGPWGEQSSQVWEASLAGGETRQVVLKLARTTKVESARVAAVTGLPTADADLILSAPKNWQVFQRYSRHRGQILVQGKIKVACDRLEVRVTGTSLDGPLPDKWQDVPVDSQDRTFDATIPLPAGGWYTVEVRAMNRSKVVAETVVAKVGIGEVFVIAGQSNATNCGEERLKTQSGKVASFSGSRWQLANDPQLGVHDRTTAGSPWPAFGDALFDKYKVPIGIASTGHSGSRVSQWQAGGEFHQWMMKRVKDPGSGGFRALLWHQGESDVDLAPAEYARLMTSLIESARKEAGWNFPWMVAQVSYHNPKNPSFEAVRTGQKMLWDKKVALEGPDTDTLRGDNRDDAGRGIHFSGKGLRAHGRMWADKVSAHLEKVLAE
jgi:serine/threonine protein kinase